MTRTFSSDSLTVTKQPKAGSAKLARMIADKSGEVRNKLNEIEDILRELQDLARRDDNAEHPYKHIEFEELHGAIRIAYKSVVSSHYVWDIYATNRENHP